MNLGQLRFWSFRSEASFVKSQVPLETCFCFSSSRTGEQENANLPIRWVFGFGHAVELYICIEFVRVASQVSATNCLFALCHKKRNITASSFRPEAGKLVSILFSNELYACKSLTCNWPSRINLESFKIVYFRSQSHNSRVCIMVESLNV